MKISSVILVAISAWTSYVSAETYYCNSTVACPEEYPCCSASEGVCGTGNYCLSGCDPRYSYNISACVPMPVCQSNTFNFNSDTIDTIVDASIFLGNATESPWSYTGYLLDYDDTVLLAMPKNSGGTVISSNFYVWYGKVSITFKSSHQAGVVSANILYSNVKDEIDLEFIGNALEQPQTNFYYQGVLNYTNEINMTTTDTFANWHTFEIDWQEDSLSWGVDGNVTRTLKRADTYNETSNTYMYPQTPSLIQISIWPGGNATNAEGTVAWAGGAINWDDSDITDSPGYFYAQLDSIVVDCYDPPAGTLQEGSKSYKFNSSSNFDEDSIMLSDDDTVLYNLGATGFNPNYGKPVAEDEDEDEDEDDFTTTYIATYNSVDSDGETQKVVKTSTSTSTATTATPTSTSTTTSATVTGAAVTDFMQDTGASSGSSSSSANAGMILNSSSGYFTSLIFFLFSYQLFI